MCCQRSMLFKKKNPVEEIRQEINSALDSVDEGDLASNHWLKSTLGGIPKMIEKSAESAKREHDTEQWAENWSNGVANFIGEPVSGELKKEYERRVKNGIKKGRDD